MLPSKKIPRIWGINWGRDLQWLSLQDLKVVWQLEHAYLTIHSLANYCECDFQIFLYGPKPMQPSANSVFRTCLTKLSRNWNLRNYDKSFTSRVHWQIKRQLLIAFQNLTGHRDQSWFWLQDHSFKDFCRQNCNEGHSFKTCQSQEWMCRTVFTNVGACTYEKINKACLNVI